MTCLRNARNFSVKESASGIFAMRTNTEVFASGQRTVPRSGLDNVRVRLHRRVFVALRDREVGPRADKVRHRYPQHHCQPVALQEARRNILSALRSEMQDPGQVSGSGMPTLGHYRIKAGGLGR